MGRGLSALQKQNPFQLNCCLQLLFVLFRWLDGLKILGFVLKILRVCGGWEGGCGF